MEHVDTSILPAAFVVIILLLFLVPRINRRMRGQAAHSSVVGGVSAASHSDITPGIPEQSSTTTLKGITEGISWTLTSTLTVQVDEDGSRSIAGRMTRWECSSPCLPPGGFILMQPHPKALAQRTEGGEGFFGKMARKIGDMALDIYVSTYFGDRYTSLVNLDGSETVYVDAIPHYFIRTNKPRQARGLLEGPLGKRIGEWKEKLQGFDQEEEVDMLGMLVHDQGIIATCMASMATEEEARLLSALLSEFAIGLRDLP